MVELVDDKKIAFLGILIVRQNNAPCYIKSDTLQTQVNKLKYFIISMDIQITNFNIQAQQKNKYIMTTIIEQAIKICKQNHLGDELNNLKKMFEKNRYNRQEIKHTIHPRNRSRDNLQEVCNPLSTPGVY